MTNQTPEKPSSEIKEMKHSSCCICKECQSD